MTQFNRRAVLGGLASLGFAARAWAQAALSEADRADVARIEAYFNGIRTLRARFSQTSGPGRPTLQGTFYLDRPQRRLRLEYDPPNPTYLVGIGGQLMHYDASLGQASFVPINSTPAGILIRETVRFSGDLQVTQVERPQGQVRVRIVRTRDPNEGSVAFTFRVNPLELVDWTITDAQPRVTRVQLTEMQVGISLDGALFRLPTEPTGPPR